MQKMLGVSEINFFAEKPAVSNDTHTVPHSCAWHEKAAFGQQAKFHSYGVSAVEHPLDELTTYQQFLATPGVRHCTQDQGALVGKRQHQGECGSCLESMRGCET